MTPLISVIVPTLRVGGLDVLFEGLRNQTFQNFELILVDSLYKYRKGLVQNAAKSFPFPVTHVEPLINEFPLNKYQHCVNTGVVYARGKLSYFTCDFSWLPPECLYEHAEFFLRSDGNTAVLGPCKITLTPPVSPHFPPCYGLGEFGLRRGVPEEEAMAKWNDDAIRADALTRWHTRYCADLDKGTLDSFYWSIFNKPFGKDDSPYDLEVLHTEMKAGLPEGYLQPQFCHLKNDSIPTERLLDVNGFDEAYDGSHGWQDTEVADRMHMRIGTQWYVKPNNFSYLLDVHDLMTIRKLTRAERSNEALYLADHATGYPNPVNNWNLRQKRLELGIVTST